MSQPRNYQTEAIIIRKSKLGEADRILTLYTPHLGKIRAVAKGVRRPRSKLAGHLELLTHSLVSFARGRNLDTITGSQTINGFRVLKDDLWLTACALYASELVDQFAADNIENYGLFQLLIGTMRRLCEGDQNGLALRYFELHLANEVGYRPQLEQCVSCQAPLRPGYSSFSASAGGVLCPDCRRHQPLSYPLSVDALRVMRLLQNANYSTASQLKLSPELLWEVERVTRHYLRYLLEREVKSAAWLDTLRREITRT